MTTAQQPTNRERFEAIRVLVEMMLDSENQPPQMSETEAFRRILAQIPIAELAG